MANDNAPRGLEALLSPQGSIRRQAYRVNASNSTAIYIGDPVVQAAAGTVDLATAGAGNFVLGAVVDFIAPAAAAFLYPYIPATCGSGYSAIVCDDPEQLYIMQEDGDTSDLALTDEGAGVDLVAGTGNTNTGLSGWQLDSSSAGATDSTLQMKIVQFYNSPLNAIGDYCRWLVRINYHQGSNRVGQII